MSHQQPLVRVTSGERSRLEWVMWAIAIALVTAAMVAVRESLDKAHVALIYLLVVLGGSARGGRVPGIFLAVTGFLCFNFFFLPPFHTLAVAEPLDWLVLAAFLLTAIVAAHLLARAQIEADASRQRAAEIDRLAALRQADELKDAVLASVSHDLRTPLTTIKALAHDIGQEGDERAVIIEEEADRLNRFVANLLDLSRLNAGALVTKPEVNAAEDLIGAALQRVGGPALGRQIHASLDPSEPLLLGRFDFVHSLRILSNLIENALKYSPSDAVVDVIARRRGDHLELIVADRGQGVRDGERERIFDPFYRPATAPSDAGSAGLGLSIARRLAEAQGGTVTCEPREDGPGSRFILRVPAADAADLN
ncbi:MAG: DUF4118 domain-containing protein [Gemmatimonadaceae bacterium]|nr:DUF4118 domain-containing protein [Gemmatimonadaceae bacterium]